MFTNLSEVASAHAQFIAENEKLIADAIDMVEAEEVSQIQADRSFKNRTGNLRAGSRHVRTGRVGGMATSLQNKMRYAKFIELGTVYIRARMFMEHARNRAFQRLDYYMRSAANAIASRF